MRLPPYIWHVLAAIVISLPIFAGLDKLPIQLWDESRLAVNAYELYKTKTWLVTTFNWEPDTWNTKPPLLIWIQVLFFKMFGVSELSLRLPSAIAGGITCLAIYFLFAIRFKRPALGLLSVLVLVTSEGYIKYHHSPRTGDYDALLTLFTTSYCIVYFLFLETNKRIYLLYTVLLITLAVMTKAIAGLLLVPGLFIYTLYRKKLNVVLKAPHLYIGIAVFFLVVVGYYYLRMQASPGYLDIVMKNDWLGRYSQSNDSNGVILTRSFYYDLFVGSHFGYWYVAAFLGIILVSEESIRRIAVFCAMLAITFLFILSFSANKSDWYDMPAYPFLSVLAATGLFNVYKILTEASKSFAIKSPLAALLLIMVVCLPPYFKIVFSCIYPDPGAWVAENNNLCNYLKEMRNMQHMKGHTINMIKDDTYAANVLWYDKVLADEGINLNLVHVDSFSYNEPFYAYQGYIQANMEHCRNYKPLERLSGSVVKYDPAILKETDSAARSDARQQNNYN